MATINQAGHRPFFLGIEGGATRSVAIVADAGGQLLARVEAGPANLKLLSDDELHDHLRAIAAQLPQPDAICLGLAGLRNKEDTARVGKAAQRVWPGTPCRACSDLPTAMAAAPAAAAPVGARVLVLSGTGSCCYGETADGRTRRLGGWGHVLGDKGSGYEIGLRALKACVYYLDRDEVWPRLGERLLRCLQLNAPEDLVAWVQDAPKKDVAALALEVFEAWSQRDKIADDILSGAASQLAKDGIDCATRLLGKKSRATVQFVLAGSVLVKQPRFAARVKRALAERWPDSQFAVLTREGAWGAVSIAQAEWARQPKAREDSASRASQKRASRKNKIRSSPELTMPAATGLSPTEERNPASLTLHKMPVHDAVRLMLNEEAKVPRALLKEATLIAKAVEIVVRTFRAGGRLFYVGAGTSGRLGALDASECPPTFRTSPELVQAIMAGGQRALWESIEGAEDDFATGAQAVAFRGVSTRDVVVGIAASGRTPFVWGALQEARRRSAATMLISFNPNLSFRRSVKPDVVIACSVGPEVLTGSTRLKAGTATKLVLNILTTLSMVRMGKVVSNLMVDLNPSNRKLRERAVRIVRDLTGATPEIAAAVLERSGWVVKEALAELADH